MTRRLSVDKAYIVETGYGARKSQKLFVVQTLIKIVQNLPVVNAGFVSILNRIVVIAVLKGILRLIENGLLQPIQVLLAQRVTLITRHFNVFLIVVECELPRRTFQQCLLYTACVLQRYACR